MFPPDNGSSTLGGELSGLTPGGISAAPASAARSRSPTCFRAADRGEIRLAVQARHPRRFDFWTLCSRHPRDRGRNGARSCAIWGCRHRTGRGRRAFIWRAAPGRHGARTGDQAAHSSARRAPRRARSRRARAHRCAGQEDVGAKCQCCSSSTISIACSA